VLRLAPVLAALLLVVACDDEDECHELGTARCAADGHAVERCLPRAEGGADLGWAREACEAPTPRCVERGTRYAACVAEPVGECRLPSFEDRCVDERTLEDCVRFRAGEPHGVKHHVRCPEGQRCGEVPPHARGPDRPPNATHACYAPRRRTEPPALVTYVEGTVHLGDEPAPTVPFRVPAGTRLRLGEDARAVVLVKERPSRLEGPGEVDVYERQPEARIPSPAARTVLEALAAEPPAAVPPDEPLLSPAPSEPGVVRLMVGEGVPGASAKLPRVAWRCETDCGRTVELRAQGSNERVLWRTTGARAVDYDGPDLEAGRTYELRVGDRTYRVRTRPPPDLRELLSAMADWPLHEQMSVVAAVHRWAGSRAAAVEALRRARIESPGDRDVPSLLEAYGVPASGR
jgi:hypothetical protein